MPDDIKTESCMLRLFGADPAALAEAVGKFNAQWNATAEWRSRGHETLLALHANDPDGLKKAAQALRDRFPAELYGEGDTTLAAAVVNTLERCDRLLVCSDAVAGALLDSRLENVPGAEKVFDFGALSYAHPQTGTQIEKRARARLHLSPTEEPDPLRFALARAQATRKIVGAELSAGCAERESDKVLILSTRKGCWLRTVPEADNPGLWLLDMIRRAAAGLPQAEGTGFLPAGRSAPAQPEKQQKKPRLGRVLLVVLLLAGLGAAWYLTGGDLTSLPQHLSRMDWPEWFPFWQAHQPKPGAKLI